MKLRSAAKLMAIVGSASTTIVMYATFIIAFLSEDRSVRVTIDTVGEALPEAIALAVFAPFMLYFWWERVVANARRMAYKRRKRIRGTE